MQESTILIKIGEIESLQYWDWTNKNCLL
jgi:hypothetical protein